MRELFITLTGLCAIAAGCVPAPQEELVPEADSARVLFAAFTLAKAKLRADFDASGVSSLEYSPEDILVRWDFTNDGIFDTDWRLEKTTSYKYPNDGTYTARLEIKDPADRTDSTLKTFTIVVENTPPEAALNVNMTKGMTVSGDAFSSSDVEDEAADLSVRWDWDGDNTYDTEWLTDKTAEHTYSTAGEYTVRVQVKDLNGDVDAATRKIIASPVTIRNAFLTHRKPYMIKLHFRMIDNLTDRPVTPDDVPTLARGNFTIFEDQLPIDVSEASPILDDGRRPTFVTLVLDFTGSMYDAGGVEAMIAAAKSLVQSQGSNTYISLWAFYERQGGYKELTDFTACTQQVEQELDRFAADAHDRGATEIWDVLKKICDTNYPQYDTAVNRAIVFLSDGHDTTSRTSVSSVINAARRKGISMFSVGLAFRPLEYPADEPNLKRVAESTGGMYFTISQVPDFGTVFKELAEDVKTDWTLSYITLREAGAHKVQAFSDFLDGYTSMSASFTVTTDMEGDIRTGLLSIVPSLESLPQPNEYTLYAQYMPRGISRLRVKLTSAEPAWLGLYDQATLCNPAQGWTISPNVAAGQSIPGDGWYTISSDYELEYGSWGRIARCVVQRPGQIVRVELPTLESQPQLYGDKTIVFEPTGDVFMEFSQPEMNLGIGCP